jgi:hypothetical protein
MTATFGTSPRQSFTDCRRARKGATLAERNRLHPAGDHSCGRIDPCGPQASAIASMATSTPGMSAPKRTIARAGFGPGKNSA